MTMSMMMKKLSYGYGNAKDNSIEGDSTYAQQ